MLAKIRWSTLTALLLITAILLSGCAAPQPAAEPAAAPVATTASEPAPAPAAASPGDGTMRELEGKLTIAVAGALPVPGAPATRMQQAWTALLAKYKELQPKVEVVIEDLPAGQTGEQWCETRKVSKAMPDISMIGECNYFRPTRNDIERGLNIATDFKQYETEINPYSGKPWKDDWIDDNVRTLRCTEQGAYDMWTCQTNNFGAFGIWVNWDILKEFGYDHTFPKTYTELYDLSAKINESGKYVAWDSPSYTDGWMSRSLWSNLTMDRFVAAGGDLEDLQGSIKTTFLDPNSTIQWCNKNFWASTNPDVQEALKQLKRYVDAYPGGGAAFYDPARDQSGQQWIIGKAAMSFHGTWLYGSILQAKDDGVLGVKDWGVASFPKLTKDDLYNKDINIAFDGELWMMAGGQGDIFAPTPNVRASGEDSNVDLLVRDWFQFMSSATAVGILAPTMGYIPANPEVVGQMDPGLKGWLTVNPPIFAGVSQPPGSYANQIVYTDDTEKNIQAWLAGQLDFETAMERADDNATRSMVKKLEDRMTDLGLTELPAECKPWATK